MSKAGSFVKKEGKEFSKDFKEFPLLTTGAVVTGVGLGLGIGSLTSKPNKKNDY